MIRVMRGGLVGLLALALSLSAGAQSLNLLKGEARIPAGETRQFGFGTVPQRDTTVKLVLRARLDYASHAGSNYALSIRVNGQTVAAAKTRQVARLTEKALVSPLAPGLEGSWFEGGKWRLVYAPDLDQRKAPDYYEGDPFLIALDITDLTNPLAENVVELGNTLEPGGVAVVVGRLEVVTAPGASPMLAAQLPAPRAYTTVPTPEPATYQGAVTAGGGLELTLGGRTVQVNSTVTGFGAEPLQLGGTEPSGGDWLVNAVALEGGASVAAVSPGLRLQRVVSFGARRVDVCDQLENTGRAQEVGLRVQYQVDLAGMAGAAVRLAGNPDPAVSRYHSPGNPTVHVSWDGQGLGLVCEDDALRNQARLYCDPAGQGAGVVTESLYLAPRESYTLRWSLYPVASGDYWDFINLVRQDWGANYTVEGAWTFFTPDSILAMPTAQLAAELRRLGVQYACSFGGWVDPQQDAKRIGFGAEVFSEYWASYRERLRQATEKLHAANPELRVLLYFDALRDTAPDAGARYPDSRLVDAAGQQQSTDWGGMYSLTWSMAPTRAGSFGQAMLEVARRYMTELGANGLYWDEMENVAYGAPLVTYDPVDGRSCVADPTRPGGLRQVGDTVLLGKDFRLAVVDQTLNLGGVVMGNGPTCGRELLGRQVQRMIETQHNDFYAYEGNLQTPLGYLGGDNQFAAVVRLLNMGVLPVGNRLSYPWEITRYLFPFTPILVYPGCLVGQERIVVTHSGKWGWPGERVACRVLIFGTDGRLKAQREAVADLAEGGLAVELEAGEVAVLAT